ncbi:MAG: CarD family transcriptional regulator [Candidatus Nitrospinota bacterium M3_3B_026]
MPEEPEAVFQVGSKIIYPSHGLGVVEKIENRDMSGLDESCYVIRLKNSGMTIIAPIKTAGAIGMREIIRKREVPKIMSILKNGGSCAIEPNWNKRQKSYMEKIKSGSIFEVASVYRDLFTLRTTKGLSFGEQQVFDNAHSLIVSELAEAKGINESKAEKMLDKALSP